MKEIRDYIQARIEHIRRTRGKETAVEVELQKIIDKINEQQNLE